jgi:hypothetical protein
MVESRFIASGIGDALHAEAASSRSVVLVAPFITRQGIGGILSALRTGARVEVFTRWRASDVAAGVSEPQVLQSIGEKKGTIRLIDSLHAKVFLFDERVAFVGSANLTVNGLGLASSGNLEALVSLAPPPTALFVFLRELAAASVLATEEDMERMIAAAESAPRREPWSDLRIPSPEPDPKADQGFPRLRAPDRLFCLYGDLTESLTSEERHHALDDLSYLALPDGLSLQQFNAAVAARLADAPLVQGIYELLVQPRRFGEITDFLKTRQAFSSHKACQRRAQVLIRWLLHFLSERFELAQPAYSEILQRATADR